MAFSLDQFRLDGVRVSAAAFTNLTRDHLDYHGSMAAYAAAKYGARGLHLVLREELRGSGVLCSLVSPGPTDTGAWDPVDPDSREGFIPRARMLRPGDVAEAVRWIAGQPGHVDVDWVRLGPA